MSPEERRQKLQEIAHQMAKRLNREWPAEDIWRSDLKDLYERVGRELRR